MRPFWVNPAHKRQKCRGDCRGHERPPAVWTPRVNRPTHSADGSARDGRHARGDAARTIPSPIPVCHRGPRPCRTLSLHYAGWRSTNSDLRHAKPHGKRRDGRVRVRYRWDYASPCGSRRADTCHRDADRSVAARAANVDDLLHVARALSRNLLPFRAPPAGAERPDRPAGRAEGWTLSGAACPLGPR